MQKIKSFDAFFSGEAEGEVTEGFFGKIADKAKQAAAAAPAAGGKPNFMQRAKDALAAKAAAGGNKPPTSFLDKAKNAAAAAQAGKKPTNLLDKAKLAAEAAKKAGVKPGGGTAQNLLSKLKAGKVSESAISVGSDYKVKIVLDIPKKVIDAYCKRVKSETGAEATSIFSKDELAEEIVKFLVKNNLNAETIPTAIAVGDSAGSSAAGTTAAPATEAPAASSSDDPFADETEEIEFDDTSDEEEDGDEVPMKKGSSAMDFEGTEVQGGEGEKDSLELDPKQPKNY